MKKDRLIDKNNITFLQKVLLLIMNIQNWYMIIPDKLGVKPYINYKTRKGLSIICRSKSTDINELVAVISGAEYPKKFIKLNDNDNVFDLGANIGGFTLYVDQINKNVNYQGYAFEPFEQNFRILKKNCKLNKLTNFSLHTEAVSGKNGVVYMDVDCLPDRVSILHNKKGRVSTKSVKLSTFCDKNKINNISLIKMDIEGSEYDVFSEDLKFISDKVNRIILEYHNLDSKHNKRWILKSLSPYFRFTNIYDARNYGVIYAENRKRI